MKHVRLEGYERKWRGCIEDNWIKWGEHPGVYIIVYEHDVHLNYEL